ncbi:protein of unknown function [Burkholderia multivorans]
MPRLVGYCMQARRSASVRIAREVRKPAPQPAFLWCECGGAIPGSRRGRRPVGSGNDRIAGLSELFRMGVWRLSRTSRTAPSWNASGKS